MSESEPDSQKQENDHLTEHNRKFHLASASDSLTKYLTSVLEYILKVGLHVWMQIKYSRYILTR